MYTKKRINEEIESWLDEDVISDEEAGFLMGYYA